MKEKEEQPKRKYDIIDVEEPEGDIYPCESEGLPFSYVRKKTIILDSDMTHLRHWRNNLDWYIKNNKKHYYIDRLKNHLKEIDEYLFRDEKYVNNNN